MSWAYIDGDNIQEFPTLPYNWKNVSNLFAMESDTQTLKEWGWYRIIDQTQPITNDFAQYHGDPQYIIDNQEGYVYKNCPIIERENYPTQQEIFDENRKNFMINLRMIRNDLLTRSDWTQIDDLKAVKSESWNLSWKQYRQLLRDLPQKYETEPLNQITDFNQIIWPALPEE